MELTEAIYKQNELILDELKGIRQALVKQNSPWCTPDEAMAILGVNNTRYLTYFTKEFLITRASGGKRYIYERKSVIELCEKIRLKHVVVPSMKEIYRQTQS